MLWINHKISLQSYGSSRHKSQNANNTQGKSNIHYKYNLLLLFEPLHISVDNYL